MTTLTIEEQNRLLLDNGYKFVSLSNPEEFDDPDDAPVMLKSPSGRFIKREEAIQEILNGNALREASEARTEMKIFEDRILKHDEELAAFLEVHEGAITHPHGVSIGTWKGEGLVIEWEGSLYQCSLVASHESRGVYHKIFKFWDGEKYIKVHSVYSYGWLPVRSDKFALQKVLNTATGNIEVQEYEGRTLHSTLQPILDK